MSVTLLLAVASALLVVVLLARRAAAIDGLPLDPPPTPSADRGDPALAQALPVQLSAEDLDDLPPPTAIEGRARAVGNGPGSGLPTSLLEAIVEINQADSKCTPLVESAAAQGSRAMRRNTLNVRLCYEPEALEASADIAPIHLVAGGDSDRGHRRKKNEDNFLFSPEQGLFVVADGMGGYAGGSVASGLAIETVRKAFEQPGPPPDAPQDSALPQCGYDLASAVQLANQVVFDVAKSRPELARMGTTLVALRFALSEQRLYVINAGDSRCYRLRQSELRQLTTDHVMSQLGVEGRQASHLFNAIGIEAEACLDLFVDKPVAGDTYLLCSDGLSKMVSDETIRDVLLAEDDPESAVYTLIEHANDAGGRDNVTVVLAKVMDGSSSVTTASEWSDGP